MVIKRIKLNECGAKANLELLQKAGKKVEDKGPINRGKGSRKK